MRYVNQNTNEVVWISKIREENPNMSIPDGADCSALGYEKLVLTAPPAQVGFHPVEIEPINNIQQWELVADVAAVINIPDTITPRQARLVLLRNGLLDEVEEAVKRNREFEIYWEYSLAIDRNHRVLMQIASELNINDEMLDDMFMQGSNL